MDHNIFGDYKGNNNKVEKKEIVRTPYISDKIAKLVEKVILPREDREICILEHEEGYVSNMNHMEATMLADAISKKTGCKWKLIGIEKMYDMCIKDEDFRMTTKKSWFHNSEIIDMDTRSIIQTPIVCKDKTLEYYGKKYAANINSSVTHFGITGLLQSAGLFRNIKDDVVYDHSIQDSTGILSLRSGWYYREKPNPEHFGISACKYNDIDSKGIVCLQKKL